jgi:hypothetical protein
MPGKVKWELWWTKWHWGSFTLSTSVSLAILNPPSDPHSLSFIIWGWYKKKYNPNY